MLKPRAYQNVDSSDEISEVNEPMSTLPARRRPWQPGFLKRLPWQGVISIILAMGCAVAAVSIAIASNEKPLDYWTVGDNVIQPAVLLSIVATIGNALLVLAFTRGATIHWWNEALHPKGTTLARLHSSYHYGSGLMAIFSSVTTFNAVAVAGLFMPILLMDTPMLQRSVGVVQTNATTHANLTIPITSSPFIEGATGIMPDHYSVAQLYSPVFAKVLREYTNRDPVLLPHGICNGTCELEVVAPGFDIHCTETTEPYTLASREQGELAESQETSNGTMSANSTYNGPEIEQTVFNIDVDYNYTFPVLEKHPDFQGAEVGAWYKIELEARRKSDTGLKGTTAIHKCTLSEAIVRYPLLLQNRTVTLIPTPVSVNRTVARVLRQPEEASMGDQPSTLGGIWLALQSSFKTNSKILPIGGWYSFRNTNPISSQYLQAQNASDLDSTNVYFDDPMSDMISMANELAFRTAYFTTSHVPGPVYIDALKSERYNLTSKQPYILSPNLTTVARSVEQNALVSQTVTTTMYATQRGWLAGAATLMFIAAVLNASTYYGWWRLGRPVSMSPLEIARAFDAPILQHADPNATGEDLKKMFGNRRIWPGLYANGSFADKIEMTSREPS